MSDKQHNFEGLKVEVILTLPDGRQLATTHKICEEVLVDARRHLVEYPIWSPFYRDNPTLFEGVIRERNSVLISRHELARNIASEVHHSVYKWVSNEKEGHPTG